MDIYILTGLRVLKAQGELHDFKPWLPKIALNSGFLAVSVSACEKHGVKLQTLLYKEGQTMQRCRAEMKKFFVALKSPESCRAKQDVAVMISNRLYTNLTPKKTQEVTISW